MAVSNCTRACRHCGKAFVRTAKGQPTKYCCMKCREIGLGIAHYLDCANCGASFKQKQGPTHKYCSVMCRHQANTVLDARCCADCGRQIEPARTSVMSGLPMLHTKRYCSLLCRHRARRKNNPCGGSHKKRAAMFGVEYAPINAVKIFDRDGWRCQLCGVKTPRSKRGKNLPTSPELDHVIPMSVGGPHLPHNVQCACRRCNGRKGAKPLGQLGLPLAA